MTASSGSTRFAIFRAQSAMDFEESGHMTPAELTQVALQGSIELAKAGYADGHRLKLLFAIPGLSLTHVWFKSGFPLPRHSHDADCLYYIIAGSIRIGTEELGPGDGFFVGADVPYSYTPGESGVELLEFRTADSFGIRLLANNPAFWAKAAETVRARKEAWAREMEPPSARPTKKA